MVKKSNNTFKDFNSLEVKNLSFKYNNSKNKILSKINFRIKEGQKIAITGLSGSGKTTLINILLGLINLRKGNILINGKILERNDILSWQRLIVFVPQSIFITEKSIKENIAFGKPKDKINTSRVKKLIKICNLEKVVTICREKKIL